MVATRRWPSSIALIGYDFIHRVERGLTYTFLLIFGVFTIGAIATLGLPGGALDPATSTPRRS